MLPAKHERFVQEYLVDLNETQAAIRAGYSKKTAQKNAHRLMANEGIKAAIAAGKARRREQTGISAAWALRRLQIEAEYTGEGATHSARVAALGLAMKHLGMLKEDAPHPDRLLLDLREFTDDALDRLTAELAPLLSPELRALLGAGEGPPAESA